jgi:hypothetical protein
MKEKLKDYTEDMLLFNKRTVRESVRKPNDLFSLLDLVSSAGNSFSNLFEERIELSEIESLLQEGFFEDNILTTIKSLRYAEEFLTDIPYLELDEENLSFSKVYVNGQISHINKETERIIDGYREAKMVFVSENDRSRYMNMYKQWRQLLIDISSVLKEISDKYTIELDKIEIPPETIFPRNVSVMSV